jgi:TatD DNase family protein
MLDTAPKLIDYHCHLDLYPNYEELFRVCTTDRIATLAVTTTPLAWPKNRELAKSSPMVRVALGIHPQLVGVQRPEMDVFEGYLPQTRFVGEIGLDAGPAHYMYYAAQKEIFERIVRLCARAGGKILSVHAVRSAKDVLDIVEANLARSTNRVVLHWFSGSLAEARRAADLGCYFSVNAAMLAKPAGARLIATIPVSRLLTETDGPFVKFGNRPARPSDVDQTTRHLAQQLGIDFDACVLLLVKNLAVLEEEL